MILNCLNWKGKIKHVLHRTFTFSIGYNNLLYCFIILQFSEHFEIRFIPKGDNKLRQFCLALPYRSFLTFFEKLLVKHKNLDNSKFKFRFFFQRRMYLVQLMVQFYI